MPPATAKGYMGQLMKVDLDTGKIAREKVPDSLYENHLSGMGLAAHHLYHHIPPNADPLGPENILGFTSGLLTGTGALFAGRWMVTGKSPLTSGWGEANCGGHFGPAIKRCGVDAIFFKGIAPEPVYLYLAPGIMELRPAGELWGKDTIYTETFLKARYPGSRVACIGPAGEQQSFMAGISTDKGRMAARSGLGAVMGAKNLKALVLGDKQRIHAQNPVEMKYLSQKCSKWVTLQPPFIPGFITPILGAIMRIMPFTATQDGFLYKIMLRKWGTISMNQTSVEMGDAPIKNWQGTSADWGVFKSASSNPDAYTKEEIKKFHCYSCPLGCGGECTMPGKKQANQPTTHKPEYESVLAFGGFIMNTDRNLIFEINDTLNRAGMDTISAGHVVAFAMACYEEEILTRDHTGGIALEWGSPEAIRFLIQAMVRREGIGNLLCDGVKKAAEKLGPRARALAVHAGGQELAMHDGRNDPGFALHYSAEPAPGRHTNGAFLYYEMYQLWKRIKSLPRPGLFASKKGKYLSHPDHAPMCRANSQYLNVMNGAGICLFGGFLGCHRTPVFDWLNAATGWELSPEEYMEIGSRVQTLKQAFNIKHGIRPLDNVASPIALGNPPQDRGANKGRQVNIHPLMRAYWNEFGWDPETGSPTPEQLKALTE